MQSLSQSIAIPGEYVGCFSLWIRSNGAGSVTLERDGTADVVPVGPAWKRAFVSGSGAGGATHATVSLTLAAGQTVEVWGLQFEAQPYGSQYKFTTAPQGIYAETYFAGDELTMTSTGPGLTSCDITLISRVR
jgi:hypothetical protein